MSIDHEKIMNRLVSEAFDNPRVGWLSDMPEDDLLFNAHNQSIEVYGVGSLDVGQLAGVVLDIHERGQSMSDDKWKPLFGNPVAPWHTWFAWHPVDTIDHGWVWMRKVNRRRCQIKTMLPGGGVRWWQHVMEVS